MKRPHFSRSRQYQPQVRVNNRIRAREIRVIGPDNRQIGVMTVPDALQMARNEGLDLVEISPSANPPVCRIVDFGKFKYEQAKKEKDTRKHQHANKVKEIQLRPGIDPHDFQTKLDHAVDFLCEDMKVKVNLRFRGRENAHQEIGFEVVVKFMNALAPYGQPDFQPKKVGRAINLMISPLPKNKRAVNPRGADHRSSEMAEDPADYNDDSDDDSDENFQDEDQDEPVRSKGREKTGKHGRFEDAAGDDEES